MKPALAVYNADRVEASLLLNNSYICRNVNNDVNVFVCIRVLFGECIPISATCDDAAFALILINTPPLGYSNGGMRAH